MSEEFQGLVSDAKIETPTPAASEPEISHLEKPAAPAATVNTGTDQWIQTVSSTLYQDGKPNYEMLPEKYWKDGAPDLSSALKARAELEKAFSRGDHKAPAEYDIAFATQAGIPEDDPLLGSFKSWAKENGISQDAFAKLASNYIDMQREISQSVAINVEREKQALGPNADKVIEEMVGWAQNLVRKGIWSADDFEEFKIMGGTARGVNALMKVREYYGDMQRIPIDVASVTDRPSREDLQAMVGDPRYQSDPAYRRKVERMFEEAFAE